jgi:hypothetical protein
MPVGATAEAAPPHDTTQTSHRLGIEISDKLAAELGNKLELVAVCHGLPLSAMLRKGSSGGATTVRV